MISMLVYIFLRVIFFDFPFYWLEEIATIAQALLIGSLFAGVLTILIVLADAIEYIIKKRRAPQLRLTPVNLAVAALLFCMIAASACTAQMPVTGIVKDAATGLTAVYKNIKPNKVLLVMNNEEIHHTDIPIGEDFLLINKDIKGLTVKNGKVSVGCSLTIKDKTGKIMLQSDDLFNRNDTFQKDSVTYLKCTVSTGKPMQWEEKYDVAVVFWDKYGTGKIENKVTIRCIDIP
jgi:hypothetical protein